MNGPAESVGNRRNFPLLRASHFVSAFADNFVLFVANWLQVPEKRSDQPVSVHAA